MRIVVHGQQAFGKAVLEALLKRGDNVIAVYVAPEKPGQKADQEEETGRLSVVYFFGFEPPLPAEPPLPERPAVERPPAPESGTTPARKPLPSSLLSLF